jgi:glycosyltransferase involved in cell wall biosynthesis
MTTPSVLVVADFWGNLEKVERHVGPLARVADPTMVCVSGGDVEGLNVRTAPSIGYRPVDLLLMGLVVVLEAARGDYDAVASFSLLPHGVAALVVGRLSGLPVHLGIIGIDVDVHATAWYGPVVRWLLRRFDVLTVPGTTYRDQLAAMGVAPDRIAILVNPIPLDEYSPGPPDGERPIDYLWVGRFAPEKDPVLFVETLARLVDDDATPDDPTAVLLGDGPLADEVRRAVRRHGLESVVELPGWIDDPSTYYRRSRTFVLTSRREALPLTLLEAMASGVAPVVTRVGNVGDVASDGRTAVVADERDPEALASAVRRLAVDPELRESIVENAAPATERYSYGAAAEDWTDVLAHVGIRNGSRGDRT